MVKIVNKISINLGQKERKEYKHKELCDKVRDYMVVCGSDEESEYHWRYLKSVYKKLSKLPVVPEAYKPLLKELEEFMLKHGKYDSGEGHVGLDAKDMFKYYD